MPKTIVDLTVTLANNMPGHRFFPRPVILPSILSAPSIDRDGGAVLPPQPSWCLVKPMPYPA